MDRVVQTRMSEDSTEQVGQIGQKSGYYFLLVFGETKGGEPLTASARSESDERSRTWYLSGAN